MIPTLTLSVCLLAAPPAAYEPQPAMPQVIPDNAGFSGGLMPAPKGAGHAPAGFGPGAMGPPEMMPGGGPGLPSGDDCPHCRHRGPHGTPFCDWWISPCNMSQHYPYWPKYGGYYYFRPYHMLRVCQQRDIAVSWGEDPRNPYDHKVFDRVYEAIRAEESGNAETLPPTETSPSDRTPAPPPAELPVPPAPQRGPELEPRQNAPAPRSENAPAVIRIKPVSAKVRPTR